MLLFEVKPQNLDPEQIRYDRSLEKLEISNKYNNYFEMLK